jgi:transposase
MSALGVDVSKKKLDHFLDGESSTIPNQKRAIAKLLKGLPPGTMVGVESTSDYWFELADMAVERGFPVYVVPADKSKKYRESLPDRADTDKFAARALSRYVENEHDRLRRYVSLPREIRSLARLFRRRMKVLNAKVALEQSLSAVPEMRKEARALLKRMAAAIESFNEAIRLRASLLPGYRELLEVTGLGPVCVAGLLICFARGEFATADSLVAFVGLDPRTHESGEWRGKKRLSKKGDPYVRRALYMAAMSASLTRLWGPLFERLVKRGIPKTAAYCILARKLVRVAWAVRVKGVRFDPAVAMRS